MFCIREVFLKVFFSPSCTVSFQKKKLKFFIIVWRCVLNTGLHYLTVFQVTGKWLKYSDRFIPAKHEYQSHFFLSRPAFPKLYHKFLKRIINIGIFRLQLLYFWWSFQLFFRFTRWIARYSSTFFKVDKLLRSSF